MKKNFEEYLKGIFVIENPWAISEIDLHFDEWLGKQSRWKIIEWANDYAEQL